MQSTSSGRTSSPIPFPSSSGADVRPTREADKAACERAAEILEFCRQTRMALQELRHGTANLLLDTLAQMDLDLRTLVHLLDERPSVVQDLTAGETDSLTTEKMVEYLERLHGCGEG
jgi:hypothetical protein